jgi:hypothetical protein
MSDTFIILTLIQRASVKTSQFWMALGGFVIKEY